MKTFFFTVLVISFLGFALAQDTVGGEPGTIPAKFPSHLGGNSPWFPGPDVNGIPYETPPGCTIDMAAFTSRHGSRYPDPSAFQQWQNLSLKIHSANFTSSGPLSFLPTWRPVLSDPDQQLSKLSPGGWKELYDMGVAYRWGYPQLYTDNSPFVLWSNLYPAAPRVVDSARLFARGFLGPNATTLGKVYSLNSSDPRSLANSLAPSDLCPNYVDDSGGANATQWADVYLPPIVARINGMLSGNLVFDASDVSLFPYLCGFESQITGTTSPWCDVFTTDELKQYEYAQDLRYYYGSGPGAGKNGTFMLPFLAAVMQRFQDGPEKEYVQKDGTVFRPSPLIATFTNDGQINQLVSEIGVFDGEFSLPPNRIPDGQRYVASRYVTMRGTIGFERLNCRVNATVSSHGSQGAQQQYVRVLLNDIVYPVIGCADGPGRSCELEKYVQIVKEKQMQAGEFNTVCGFGNGTDVTTFLTDTTLPFESAVTP
ncbi:acid phosphatase PHO12 precursor [Viridothelium virens]|uniref:Acid phosphatase PHO12 n=1 Tax=Viridothelium virens TaxID=1048519 RepID=A0A6A6HGP9_VIRVR|nr:acid phosphatase PHO12 precursor [Viridothelium virens]